MDKRQITHPKDLTLPLWAWHTRDWKHKKPDLRNIGLGTPGEKSVCIEFEIDDKVCFISIFIESDSFFYRQKIHSVLIFSQKFFLQKFH